MRNQYSMVSFVWSGENLCKEVDSEVDKVLISDGWCAKGFVETLQNRV